MYHEDQKVSFHWHSVDGKPDELLSKLREALGMHKTWLVLRPNMTEDITMPKARTSIRLQPESTALSVNMGNDSEGIDGMYVSIKTNHGALLYGFSSLNYMRVKIYDDDSIELAEGNFGDPEPKRVIYIIPQN